MLTAMHAEGWRGYAFVVFLIACIGTVLLIPRQSARDALLAITPGQMPACDSPPSRHMLAQAVSGSPAARTQGIVLQKVGSLRDAFPGINEYEGQRTCLAEIYTNAGRETATTILTWTSADRNEVHLSVIGLF
ncbi:hypothetical protein ASF22_22375 [Methylobacterium sp. Leaf87]|uniref:hypothetical protein n=1 Tax=Methylobacterium sp. Leaf87 TaxID=1736243 RepID=UPI00070064F2|nr:hypothetical protein [Methylobacterium sp. Leaf87]KQO60421.1 hypothetical protein ASF22_22375 [Methylobacterium sp. Leaf87]